MSHVELLQRAVGSLVGITYYFFWRRETRKEREKRALESWLDRVIKG
jgi:hypothetical protein